LQQFKLGHYWPIPTLDNNDSPCLPYTQEHKLHHRIGCASIEFKQHFPNATIIELQHNYWCVSNVVDLSNDLIAHAGYPFKPTQSARGKGKIDFLGCFMDDNEEAAAIVEEIKQLNVDGRKWSDMVVLSRTNAQSRPLEEKLVKAKGSVRLG